MSALQPFAELIFIGLLILAYLFGSIPWGVILTRIFTPEDIRHKGSGNIGATNVTREVGVMPGILTLIGDILKGLLPVYLTLVIFDTADRVGDIYVSAVALAALLGHLYPVYLKFRGGGKGVATAAGSFPRFHCRLFWPPLSFSLSCCLWRAGYPSDRFQAQSPCRLRSGSPPVPVP